MLLFVVLYWNILDLGNPIKKILESPKSVIFKAENLLNE